MSKFKIVLIAIIAWSISSARSPAQTTNLSVEAPATVLETLEGTVGQLIIKSTAPVGSLPVGPAMVSVVCKEDTLVSTGEKEHGVALGIKMNGQPEDRTVIDYDEMDALLHSIDYLSKVDWSVTTLPGFDINYTTKAGLRVAAFSSKRAQKIQFSMRSSRMVKGILLTPEQVGQLYSLLAQGKTQLDALRNGTNSTNGTNSN